MDFNTNKFELLSYNCFSSVDDTRREYFAPDCSLIIQKNSLRDLGIIMSTNMDFQEHIHDIVAKGRRVMSWVLRTFRTRQPEPMLILFKYLILPILEYACQLWSPASAGLIRELEGVQRTFTSRIHGARELNYWNRLKSLKLYSLERRRDRYMILYTFKILNGLVPNFSDANRGGISSSFSLRRGLQCHIPAINKTASAKL